MSAFKDKVSISKKIKPDISLAKKILNWSPKTSLEEGLKKTINYFEKC